MICDHFHHPFYANLSGISFHSLSSHFSAALLQISLLTTDNDIAMKITELGSASMCFKSIFDFLKQPILKQVITGSNWPLRRLESDLLTQANSRLRPRRLRWTLPCPWTPCVLARHPHHFGRRVHGETVILSVHANPQIHPDMPLTDVVDPTSMAFSKSELDKRASHASLSWRQCSGSNR